MRWLRRLILTLLAFLTAFSAASSPSELVNEERAKRDIPVLKLSAELDETAQAQSDRMAADGTIYHNPKLGDDNPKCGWGENVGMGPSVQAVHEAFMASPGHKSNILSKKFTHLGTGVTWKDGTVYVTHVFRYCPTPKPKPAPSKPKPEC